MNVVVVVLNGCPVSALGPYGNEWIGTPNLDRLAAEGVVFDRHVSDCPDPAAARRAWLGKPLPPTPSPQRGGGAVSSSPPRRGEGPGEGFPLLSQLRARGVRTVLVRSNREVNDAPPDFYAGWDERFDARSGSADEFLDVLSRALDHLANFPAWLLWIDLDRLLPPWDVQQDVFEAYVEDLLEDEAEPAGEPLLPWADPPTGWFDRDDLASWELLHRTFAAVVTVFDAELGWVLELFRDRGLDRSAAWVFTADRGLPLGEHGLIGFHRPWLHEELVHVPLIVRLPDAAEAGRRVAGLTQPADLMPTLAHWLGVEAAAGYGFDLAPLIEGTAESVRPFVCTLLESGPAVEWAIRTPEWAYLLPVRPHSEDDPREPLLYEKPDDRWEVNDLRSREPDRAEELERTLREAVRE